jgi:elongation factor G
LPNQSIRNIALIGHSGAGKTSLSEAMLYAMGAVDRLGRVEEGNTASDYQKDEIERQISIAATPLYGTWGATKINLVDTPGFSDFAAEVRASLRVVDGAVVSVDGFTGPEVGTELVWKYAQEQHVPRAIFINRLDKEHVSFDRVLQSLKELFGSGVVPLQIPLGEGPDFGKIADLLTGKVYTYTAGSPQAQEGDVPPEAKHRFEEMRRSLMESVAETNEELLEIYYETNELSKEQLVQGLRREFTAGHLFPVLCGSAYFPAGVDLLLNFIAEAFPSPEDRLPVKGVRPGTTQEIIRSAKDSALTTFIFKTVSEQHLGELSFFRVFSGEIKAGSEVFNATQKTAEKIGQLYNMNGKVRKNVDHVGAGDIGAVVKLKNTHTGDTLCDSRDPLILPAVDVPHPVHRVAVVPKAKGDEEKLSTGLHSLHEEDPSFIASYDPELKQTIVAGQGELQINIILKRLKDKYGVDVETEAPRVPYRETIRKAGEGQGKHKKQSGGRGQYGDVWLRLEPRPRGSEDNLEFVDAIVGGVVPGRFIPAAEKGIRAAMEEGVISGNQVVDIRATLYDGSYHDVDSSEMAFKIAASMGFKRIFKVCQPIILEPIYDIEVTVPEEYMGDVMGDISSRRGKIQGMDHEGKFQIIKAKLPLAELATYSINLRSMTSGRGLFRMKFSHYEQVPHEVQDKLVAAYEARREEGSL